MMTGAEAAVKDADREEREATARERGRAQAAETARATEEASIDNELLDGLGRDNSSSSESDHSEIEEIVFATPISPPRGTILHPLRLMTPNAATVRKRSFTLVQRTPEKPREAPVAPTTPSASITREPTPVTSTTQEPTETPPTTAPARLDGRERRAGKNTAYLEAMAIERGTGRGGRRGGRGRDRKA
jgi:hypothetical protein